MKTDRAFNEDEIAAITGFSEQGLPFPLSGLESQDAATYSGRR
jgi:hypothetical protein